MGTSSLQQRRYLFPYVSSKSRRPTRKLSSGVPLVLHHSVETRRIPSSVGPSLPDAGRYSVIVRPKRLALLIEPRSPRFLLPEGEKSSMSTTGSEPM